MLATPRSTITVEDLKNDGDEAFAAEIEVQHGDLLAIQRRLRKEESLRLAIETKYKAVVEDVLPLLLKLVLPKQEFNIGQLTAPMIIEGRPIKAVNSPGSRRAPAKSSN